MRDLAGNKKAKCLRYLSAKKQIGHALKFDKSKAHRGCGPLSRYVQFSKAVSAAYASTHSGRDGVVIVLNGKITIAS